MWTPGSPKVTPSRREQCTSAVVAWSKILGFHSEDSLRSQNNAFKKDIARQNQLRPYLEFSPWKTRLWTLLMLPPPLSYCCCETQNTKQVPHSAETRISIASPPIRPSWYSPSLTSPWTKSHLMATKNGASCRSLLNQTVGIKAWMRTTEYHLI
jgi:hypothetical protein